MPADQPTILATSGGLRSSPRTTIELGPLVSYAFELAGVNSRRPKLCFVGTALGDQAHWQAWWADATRAAGVDITFLNLFPMPNVADPLSLLGDADVVWVGGGSVANLLALWRLHGLKPVFEEVWRAGVVLSGVSAGSLCWHAGGTTDSFGPDLRPVTDALGFLPYANGVHYDAEVQRRPLLQKLVGEGTLPAAYATDNGVGLVYRATEMVEAVTEAANKGAYYVQQVTASEGGSDDGAPVREERIEPRLLSG
jgi:peptidase E